MTKAEMMQALRAARVVPVVRTSTTAHAATAIGWLRDAGIRIFELTMTIPDAPALIRELAGERDLLLGAGTVADVATAEACALPWWRAPSAVIIPTAMITGTAPRRCRRW